LQTRANTQMKHFDGSERAEMPSAKSLVVGSLGEFTAMTLFVFFGCGAAASNAHFSSGEWDSASVTIISLQFGLGITCLAYAFAHTSGAHINCAVTLALTIVGTCHPVRALCYFIAQMFGSALGAALLLAATTEGDTVGCRTGVSPCNIDRTGGLGSNGLQNNRVSIGNAVVGELMGTALLVFVVLETAVNTNSVVATDAGMIRGTKQTLAPFPIGLAVFLAHCVLVPITGCSINPTRSFGPALVSDTWKDHWIWWVGPCSGAVVGALHWGLFKLVDNKMAESDKVVPSSTHTKVVDASSAS